MTKPTEAAAAIREVQSLATPRTFSTRPGTHYPPGAVADEQGVNFSIFARNAVAAELRLYQDARSREPFQIIRLTSEEYRTFFFWHVYVEALPPGTYYTWRVAGPGQSLDSATELLDPWARAVSDTRSSRSGFSTSSTTPDLASYVTTRGLNSP